MRSLAPEAGKLETEALPDRIAKRIAQPLGITRWIDLALHLPLRYQDEATLSSLHDLTPGVLSSVVATVIRSEIIDKPRRQWYVEIADDSGMLLLRWLHFYPNQVQRVQVGITLKATGVVRQRWRGLEMVHPKISLDWMTETPASSTDDNAPNPHGKLTPIYPTTAGVKQSDWTRWVHQLPPACYEDVLTEALGKHAHLLDRWPTWPEALTKLHAEASSPEDQQQLNTRCHPAWHRIQLEELVAHQLAMRKIKAKRQSLSAPRFPATPSKLYQTMINSLPYHLTQAQLQAIAHILQDLDHTLPMQRLLQGDVGSGKTVVALLACVQVASSGWQAALMAPTEILAQQHFEKFKVLLLALGLRPALLIGALRPGEKQMISEGIATGAFDIIIGTHALIQKTVRFLKLGLVVVDEQHRFGVQQRIQLASQHDGPYVAHQLLMSATPIPRTLTQSFLADLDVSVLDEKPPGRQPIVTKLIHLNRRNDVIDRLAEEVSNGRQIYWVCPLIAEQEDSEQSLQAAEVSFRHIVERHPRLRVALLHGRHSAKEKADTMQAFAHKTLDILVATTVIEVGVDVPSASLMVVEQAERFGLAQLHQLRGRVGRGQTNSVCLLLFASPLSQTARIRLTALRDSEDGFWLAEQDLKLRGPGDLLGVRQSGLPMLRYADPMHQTELLKAARDVATQLHQTTHPELTDRLITRWYLHQQNWMG